MTQDLRPILSAFGLPEETRLTPITVGLINQTFLVEYDDTRRILQRVNPIFGPEVHEDIEAVTAHLEARGLLTPRLLRTTSGGLFHASPEGVYRLMSYLPGMVLASIPAAPVAEAAGALVARFHRATSDLQHEFRFARLGVHDTTKHMATLSQALDEHRAHPNYEAVAWLGEQILEMARRLEPLPEVPVRITHGDLKISNLLFSEELHEGRALLDLDTLGKLSIPVELGDALRSWCNPAGEDYGAARFDRDIFAAALRGYAAGSAGFLTPDEIDALVLGAQTISLELSARFCADALRECYFGWNPQKFSSRSEHNRVRALSQWSVSRSVAKQRARLERLTRAIFYGEVSDEGEPETAETDQAGEDLGAPSL
jgi:Ser/Thr protein kinase RdoA (MazF antagonist)